MKIQEILFNNLDKILASWMLLDEQDNILHWSRPAEKTLGYSVEEIQGSPFFELLPEDHPRRSSYLQEIMLNNPSSPMIDQRLRFRQKNGVLLDAEMSLYLIKEEDKQYKLITFEKVTEIVELRHFANNKQLQLLDEFHFFHGANYSIYTHEIYDAVLVAVTAEHGLRFNRAFLLMVDHSDKCIRGIQAIGPNDQEEANRIYAGIGEAPRTLTEMISQYQTHKTATDSSVNNIVRQLTIPLYQVDHILIQALYGQRYILANDKSSYKDNPSFHWLRETLHTHECLLVPLVWHGRSIGLLIADNAYTKNVIDELSIKRLTQFAKTAVDVIISVRLLSRLEDSIAHVQKSNQKLQESQEKLLHQERLTLKGQMIEQMAHEVRGPLSVIGGYAGRVYRKLDKENEHYQSLGRIVETARTLELVLNDILHTDQKEKDIPRVTDCGKCVNRVINLLEEEISLRKVSVNINIQGDLPQVKMSEHHLFEVLNNLVKNALEALESGGLLSIRAFWSEDFITLRILDTGPGIPPSQVEQIFSPYFTTKEEGTGLGLVVVKNLIEQYNGHLRLNSNLREGTEFIITLPSEPKEENHE